MNQEEDQRKCRGKKKEVKEWQRRCSEERQYSVKERKQRKCGM